MSPNYKVEGLLGLCTSLPLFPGFKEAGECFHPLDIDVQQLPPVIEDPVLLIEIKLELP